MFTSFHPKYIKVAIPFNFRKRIFTMVSDRTNRALRQDLKRALTGRPDPTSLMDEEIKCAKKLDAKALRTRKINTTQHLKI